MLYDQNEHYISCKCFFENMSDINVNTHTQKNHACVFWIICSYLQVYWQV